ncbi:hypothetical protein DYI22_01235 [Marinobacter lipolyticus]|uniref:hypothetical protein n=1 Tax=Marinobacter lipolyticus TaxID=209639 RepID=UPI001BCD99CB|nr:hypothetical protein [Marinobacter lipolyticus]MBS8239124.1 hypothetical protein [Marinobacter lipolyticus]
MGQDKPVTTIGQKNGRAKGWLIFLGSLLGGFLGVITVWLIFSDSSSGLIDAANGILFNKPNLSLSQQDTLLLQRMIESGSILTPSETMAEVSSFYERVITILTTLIAFLGVIAYMYVRTVSEESALRTVREAVVSQIDSEAHKQDVKKNVKELVEPELKRRIDAKIAGLDSYIRDLDERIAELDKARASMPSDKVIEDIYAQIGSIAKRISMDDKEEADTDGQELDLDNETGSQE